MEIQPERLLSMCWHIPDDEISGSGSPYVCYEACLRHPVWDEQVSAGQFLQQFFNPYYRASAPPASPASPSSPSSGLPALPQAASFAQLVQQLVASRAPAAANATTMEPPAGVVSPVPSPVSSPSPTAAAQAPIDSAATAAPLQPAAPAEPPAAVEAVAAAADGPGTTLLPMLNPQALAPASALGLLGSGLPGQDPGSLLPAGISALATAAVLADQVRPQVDDLAGLISREAAGALSDSPFASALRSARLPGLGTQAPPPPAGLDALLLGLINPQSPPAPPPYPSTLLDALSDAGSLVNTTVSGLTENVR